MPPVTIANPILNSPYVEPQRHFRFDDEGITSEIVEKRRLSGYFVPIPQPKKKGQQLSFHDAIGSIRLAIAARQSAALVP